MSHHPVFLLVLALAATVQRPLLADEKPRSSRWNLLLITADDLNADSAGWLGDRHGATPNLDAFARSAHRFRQAHVTVPICQPGREALLTGRVPHRSGALGFNPIRKDVPTLVEVLNAAGYHTGAIAKTAHMMPATKFPWHETGGQELGKKPRAFRDRLREMMDSARSKGKPFFINANITDPHRPFVAESADNKQADLPKVFKAGQVAVPAFLEDLPEVRREVAQYYSSVSRFDLTFGMVLDALRDTGRADDTVVLFLSDHGMSFPFAKATVYRNGTWSPVLLKYPGMGQPQEREELVSSVDIMPSLLELLGVEPPTGMDGRSWVSLLKGRVQPDRDLVVTHVNTISSGKSFAQRCARTRDRALIYHAWAGGETPFRVEAMSGLTFAAMNKSGDPGIKARIRQLVAGETLMLFDTSADPSERRNLIREPALAGEAGELSRRLLDHMRKTEDPLTEAFGKAWEDHNRRKPG